MHQMVSLNGTWQFRFEDEPEWRPLVVPGCWEAQGWPMERPGPAWYRRVVVIPPEMGGDRVWLCFGAVSYHCRAWVNGSSVGEHTGLWDAFRLDITAAVTPGAEAEIVLQIDKPASLTAGPDSPHVPGTFPLRETLSGFLPYVWGHMFGGIWQDVALVSTGPAFFGDVHVRGDAAGRLRCTAELSRPGTVTLELLDPDGQFVMSSTQEAKAQAFALREPGDPVGGLGFTIANLEVEIPRPRRWSPADPALYTARLQLADGDEREIRFGLRTLAPDGPTIRLNGAPIYPRMVLSWGWYAGSLHSNPGPEQVRGDLLRLKSLGYNGVKLCLWFPPPYYFDLADELGMLLWVELPMWLPQVTGRFRAQVEREYARLLAQAHNHPSVIVYTLGCELNRAVGDDLLGPLYRLVKQLGGDALVRDNSGSGEVYGGLLNEHADFYDHHFYADLQHLRGLLDAFAPRWRAPLPWLFGEFCDYDTFRDPLEIGDRRLEGDEGDRQSPVSYPQSPVPWWASPNPLVNPQGARWLMELPHHEERLREAGLLARGGELRRISELHGLLHRKYTLELVRAHREVSGYVVTGEVDTPISTAGMWNDGGRLKFEPDSFRAFNDDLVALVGWDRRRAWEAGGDRAAPWDTWSYPAGALVRPHLIASHYGSARGPAHVAWSASFAEGPTIARGETTTSFDLAPGDLREVAVAEFRAPEVSRPRQAELRVEIRIGSERARNSWPLWLFPRDPWRVLRGVALVDPSRRLDDLRRIAPEVVERRIAIDGEDDRPPADDTSLSGSSPVLIATSWTADVRAFVERGGSAVLLQDGGAPGPLPTCPLPFWREALRLCEPHPAWGDFPHEGWAGLQFLGCAAGHALNTAGRPGLRPILRRLDTRTMALHDYAVELAWGAGRLIVSTLRFEGGQGEQPLGLGRNTAAAYLLAAWVRFFLTTAR